MEKLINTHTHTHTQHKTMSPAYTHARAHWQSDAAYKVVCVCVPGRRCLCRVQGRRLNLPGPIRVRANAYTRTSAPPPARATHKQVYSIHACLVRAFFFRNIHEANANITKIGRMVSAHLIGEARQQGYTRTHTRAYKCRIE